MSFSFTKNFEKSKINRDSKTHDKIKYLKCDDFVTEVSEDFLNFIKSQAIRNLMISEYSLFAPNDAIADRKMSEWPETTTCEEVRSKFEHQLSKLGLTDYKVVLDTDYHDIFPKGCYIKVTVTD